MASFPELRPRGPALGFGRGFAAVRRALLLGLVPVLALAAVLVLVVVPKLAGTASHEGAAPVPAFLTKALGLPQAGAKLVQRPGGGFTTRVTQHSFSAHLGR